MHEPSFDLLRENDLHYPPKVILTLLQKKPKRACLLIYIIIQA